jgi:hypothetical protein
MFFAFREEDAFGATGEMENTEAVMSFTRSM